VLRAAGMSQVFTARPDDRREADVLMRQLRSINISKVALVVDGYEPAREAVVAEVLHAGGIDAQRISLDPNRASIERALREVALSGAQGIVLNLGPDSIDWLDQTSTLSHAALPSMVVSVGSVGITQLARTMGERTLGYTAVVPNPEVSQLPLLRGCEKAAESVAAEAVTFEGLASYLHMRVVVEALSRLGGRLEPGRMAAAIESLDNVDFGGFRLRFGPQRHQGSDYVELGVRTREGRLRR